MAARLTFTSHDVERLGIRAAAERVLASVDMPEGPARLRLCVALQEALVNAHEHGNLELRSEWKERDGGGGADLYAVEKRRRLAEPLFAARVVTCTAAREGTCVTVSVKDSGGGFPAAYASVPVGSDGGRVVTYGRGLALMRAAADDAWFEEGGSKVVIVKAV